MKRSNSTSPSSYGREVTLRIRRKEADVLAEHMRQDIQNEQMAFGLGVHQRTAAGTVFMLNELVLPDPSDLAHQSAGRVCPTREFQSYVYFLASLTGQDIVEFHTHPGSDDPLFSFIDQQHAYDRDVAHLCHKCAEGDWDGEELRQVRSVVNVGIPEVASLMDGGVVPIDVAAKIASLSVAEQSEVIASVKRILHDAAGRADGNRGERVELPLDLLEGIEAYLIRIATEWMDCFKGLPGASSISDDHPLESLGTMWQAHATAAEWLRSELNRRKSHGNDTQQEDPTDDA